MVKLLRLPYAFCLLYLLSALLLSCSSSTGNVQSDEQVKGTASYSLGVGDTINIVVFGEPELTMEVVLNNAGTFTYPYLGKLNILGKSLEEVQSLLVEGLSDGYLVDPKVSVTMDKFREVYIGGEVAEGGNFPFQPGLTVGKAIVLAGGFTDRASRSKIYVVSESAKDGKGQRVTLDYVLKPGDVITVQRRFF